MWDFTLSPPFYILSCLHCILGIWIVLSDNSGLHSSYIDIPIYVLPQTINVVFFFNLTLQTPKSDLTSFTKLTKYLEKRVGRAKSRDEIMVRAILVWLSHQEVEKFTSEEGTRDTPLGFLSLLGQKRSTYSTFFTLLCRYKRNLLSEYNDSYFCFCFLFVNVCLVLVCLRRLWFVEICHLIDWVKGYDV